MGYASNNKYMQPYMNCANSELMDTTMKGCETYTHVEGNGNKHRLIDKDDERSAEHMLDALS